MQWEGLLGKDYASFFVSLKDLRLCDFERLEGRSVKRICIHTLHVFREALKGNWRLGCVFFRGFLLQRLKYIKSVNADFYISEHM